MSRERNELVGVAEAELKQRERDVGPPEPENLTVFWRYEVVNKNQDIKWKIDHLKYIEFLFKKGFRRFDIEQDYIFTYIKNQVIEEIPLTRIQDEVIKYINSLNTDIVTGGKILKKAELLGKFYSSPGIYFNERKLSLLGVEPNLQFNKDSKEASFIYFQNGFVKCTSKGYQLFPYNKLEGYIFKKQIKNRKFKKHNPEGMFKKFVQNISGNEQRFEALKTIFGYLLHGFFEGKMKAINLTDSTISDVAEGRTGKSIVGKAIGHIKNVCEIMGKDFDPANKHKYASANLDTQIVFLNDTRKRFNFETLFNDISDAITVDKKNLQPFQIRAKMLIASNDTFRTDGASAQDRVIEFELSNHYGMDYSPEDEFGCWLFADWNETEWLSFDNFMLDCIVSYLRNGILKADAINLEQRKKIQHTNIDFVEFIDEKIKSGDIRRGIDIVKNELHEEFLENYPEYREDRWLKRTSNFIKYLKTFASLTPELKGKIDERKSNGKSIIKFKKDEPTLGI